MKLFLALFFAATTIASAQSIEVPHKLQFADLTLTIRDDARREIQKDVDALTRYPKSFNVKVERARTFFPVIEKIFAEENVPDDFKYLVIQESALVADAVSTSNAVGYWQFKDFTAIEMGLRVDRDIDERMNIVSATRAAARYIKKNNSIFNNWLYALQSYQMGAGGVMRSEKNTRSGEKKIDITGNTYWYVKKYLAHKIAYEGFTKGEPEIKVVSYPTITDKRTLSDIGREMNVDIEELKLYNKWLKGNRIPEDRTYAVMIPVKGDPSGLKLPEATPLATTVGLNSNSTKAPTVKTALEKIKINGIVAVRAREKETPTALAARAGVDLSAFLKWNDISISDPITSGSYYLLGKKRNRATQAYHKVSPGETLWSVSQQYGVQIKRLRKFNRLSEGEEVTAGTTLWLATQRPKDEPAQKSFDRPVEVNENETFAWDVTPTASSEGSKQTIAVKPIEVVVVSDSSAVPPIKNDVIMADTPSEQIKTATDSVIQAPVSEQMSVVTIPSDSVVSVPVVETPLEKKEVHVVQPKETLYAIARQYGVGVMDLVNWNNLDLQQGIRPGQELQVTAPSESAIAEEEQPIAMNIVHEVKPTDTVYSIARKYGVTIKELMEWNNKRDFNLAVGEKLKIIKR